MLFPETQGLPDLSLPPPPEHQNLLPPGSLVSLTFSLSTTSSSLPPVPHSPSEGAAIMEGGGCARSSICFCSLLPPSPKSGPSKVRLTDKIQQTHFNLNFDE